MRFALLIIFMAIVIGACGSDPSTPLSQQTLGEYMEDNIDISARVETVDGMTQIFADIGVDACGVGVCYFDTELLCSSYCARDCADTCEVRYLQDNRGRNCAEDADEVNAARAHCAGTGPDNGGGTNCRDDPDICLGDRPICRYDNRCVECLGDSDCGGYKPHCSAGGECRECIFPGDCNRGDTCDIWTGTCVPEQSDDDNDNDGNQGSSDNGDSDNGE